MDEHDYRSLDESLEEKKRNSSIFSLGILKNIKRFMFV